MLNQFQFMQRANQAIAMIALNKGLAIHGYNVSRESIEISFTTTSQNHLTTWQFYDLAQLEKYAYSK